MSWQSCMYEGAVLHRRLKPRRHQFRYLAYWLLFDLDELAKLDTKLTLFSVNRFNLFSFFPRDHGDSIGSLRPWIEALLAAAGIESVNGPIRLLCMPRILGYAFNPISIYFCFRNDGSIAAVVYEVHNTFHQRHTYVIDARHAGDGVIRQHRDKNFYVSPFLAMDIAYEFRVKAPGAKIAIAIRGDDRQGAVIATALQGDRRELNDWQLLRAFFVYPLVTLKVISAIHWEAFRLWLKGVKLQPRPLASGAPLSAAPAPKQRERSDV